MILSCSKRPANSQLDKSDKEYFEKFYAALSSKDTTYIESTIHYIDEKLSEGKSNIASIHYNKAQLLYRLRRYDEALQAIEEDNQNLGEFHAATLLLRLRRKTEAIKKFERILRDYDEQLGNRTLSRKDRGYLLQSKITILHLLREDTSEIYAQLHELHSLSEAEMSMIAESMKTDPDQILLGMWPD